MEEDESETAMTFNLEQWTDVLAAELEKRTSTSEGGGCAKGAIGGDASNIEAWSQFLSSTRRQQYDRDRIGDAPAGARMKQGSSARTY